VVLHQLAASVTVRELLAAIVEKQIDDYSSSWLAESLEPCSVESADELGPVDGRAHKTSRARPPKFAAQQRIANGVAAGTIRVFIDGEPARELDRLIDISAEPEVMFVRLVKLRGPGW